MYNEIYNSQNKWDKDYELYRAFDMDESFFTQTKYLKSKHRRALVSSFFSKSAISEMQHLIRDQVRSLSIYSPMICWSPNRLLQLDRFCDALQRQNAAGM